MDIQNAYSPPRPKIFITLIVNIVKRRAPVPAYIISIGKQDLWKIIHSFFCVTFRSRVYRFGNKTTFFSYQQQLKMAMLIPRIDNSIHVWRIAVNSYNIAILWRVSKTQVQKTKLLQSCIQYFVDITVINRCYSWISEL